MPVIDAPDKLPSVDRLLNDPEVRALGDKHGRPLVTGCARKVLAAAREQLLAGKAFDTRDLVGNLHADIERTLRPSLRRVFNLTGTVLHTNLGRAILPRAAIDAMIAVAGGASNLEFDLDSGKRGDRHAHCETLLRELTGAERALVVNNNAAAVLLTLNSLALRKQVPVSRGELIEIGGSFRMPDIMARAGCRLIEVGTTNRTHATDFEQAIGAKTALLLKVHTSNYAIRGFTASLSEAELATISHAHGLPLVSDLGSGNLIDLEALGLPREATVRAVLRLYTDPARLAETLPTLRHLTRDAAAIEDSAARLAPVLRAHCQAFEVSVEACKAQVGSGALPVDTLDSTALKLSQPSLRRPGKALQQLAGALRELPIPVLGRIDDDALWLDLRCLDDEAEFVENLRQLEP